ncbi:hypothetical protein AHF37_08529, partial [Paragonimus kellicotti]
CRADCFGAIQLNKLSNQSRLIGDRYRIWWLNRLMISLQFFTSCSIMNQPGKEVLVTVDDECQPGQFRCRDGSCIPSQSACDGRNDCPDGSDESPSYCPLCDPVSKPCEAVNGRAPTASHFQIHWLCDGENDCGNGFDELNCRNDTRHLDPHCGSTHFQCGSGSRQYIPFSYWCDGTADCANGEDEHDCSRPSVIDSGSIEPYRIKPGGTLVLECESLGVPPPMIIWRFNWGCLPNESRARAEVLPSSHGCRGSRNRLTITNFRAGDDGIYNCEALISTHRAMSQDFMVLVD